MDLEKFWLGNVNERGEVDQEGYDEETKDGLLRTTRNEKLTSEALDEKDTRRVDEDLPVDAVPKAVDAVDYSREEEAVEDNEPANSSDYYYSKQSSYLSACSV
jgi:hypothetical protein